VPVLSVLVGSVGDDSPLGKRTRVPDSSRSSQVSLDTYGHVPVLAIGIELVFALGRTFADLTSEARRGRPSTRRRSVALYMVFAVGILAWLPATSTSPGQTFG
jgi:hypothetical protein